MTPPFEFSEPRRSFVKKTLATTVGISFAGLIRADGAVRGSTNTTSTTTVNTTIGTGPVTTEVTTAPDTSIGTEPETTWLTTAPSTTIGTEPESTVPESTIGEEMTTTSCSCECTHETTEKKTNFLMKCTFPEQPSWPVVFNANDPDPTGWVNEGTEEAPWWRRVWVKVRIESNKTKDEGWYPSDGVTFTCKGSWTLGPGMVVQDPFSAPPATGWSDWAVIERSATITCDKSNGKMTRSRTAADMLQQQGDTQNDGSKLETSMAGGEGGTQTVTVKYKAPYGEFGDSEEATVIWVSEDREGK